MSGVGNLFPPATRHRIGDPRSHDDNDVTRSGHNAQPRNVRSAIAVVRILPATIASACRALGRVPAGPPAPRTVMQPRMPTHVHHGCHGGTTATSHRTMHCRSPAVRNTLAQVPATD